MAFYIIRCRVNRLNRIAKCIGVQNHTRVNNYNYRELNQKKKRMDAFKSWVRAAECI